jgi:hypothetical protein
MFRYEDEDYRNQLGDKYDAFSQELNQINRRMLPMDAGPNSANAKASKQQQADRDALFQRYGVKPAAPNPDIISKLKRGDLAQSKLVNGARLNPSVPVTQPVQERPIVAAVGGPAKRLDLKNDLGSIKGRFNELRNRFKK